MGILGFVVMMMMIVTGVSLAGNFDPILDIPSGIAISGMSLGALMISFGTSFGSAARAAFSREPTQKMLVLGVIFFKRGKSYAIASGILSTIILIVRVLLTLDDPSQLNPAIASALPALGYGLLLAYGVCRPLEASLQGKLDR